MIPPVLPIPVSRFFHCVRINRYNGIKTIFLLIHCLNSIQTDSSDLFVTEISLFYFLLYLVYTLLYDITALFFHNRFHIDPLKLGIDDLNYLVILVGNPLFPRRNDFTYKYNTK